MKSEGAPNQPSTACKLVCIAFGSRLTPFANDILWRRYHEKTPVNDMLAWLKDRGVGCSREAFQVFLRRLLRHLPDGQAEELGIGLPMLHAVRRRLGLAQGGSKLIRTPYVRYGKASRRSDSGADTGECSPRPGSSATQSQPPSS